MRAAWVRSLYKLTRHKPPAPTLCLPDDGATVYGTSVNFQWDTSEGAFKYYLAVSTSSDFWAIEKRIFGDFIDDVVSYTLDGFPNDGTTYYWWVWGYNEAGVSRYVDAHSKGRHFINGEAPKQRIRRYFASHQIRKLQIGTGGNILAGWLNTDINATEEQVFLDATKPFAFDDCTFDYIFCEHLIEHLEYQKGIDLLCECFRILRPGGKIRIATPDIRFLIELYNSEKTELQDRYISWAVDRFLSDIGIYQDVFVINNFFRDWGHRFIYDFKALRDAMSRVGFMNIARYNVGQSDDENLHGIEGHGLYITDEFNRLETFAVEGQKPD